MKKTITITAMNRPELFRGTLKSLQKNNISGWHILIGIEPGLCAAELKAICLEELARQSFEVIINPAVLGLRLNPHRLMETAFAQGSELNLYIEEDFLLAPDAACLALWYHQHHKPEFLCLNLLSGPCGTAGLLSDARYPNGVIKSKTFNSIGFAVRKQEWVNAISPAWLAEDTQPEEIGGFFANWRTRWGWDYSVYGLLAATPNLFSVQPILARATHTGAEGVNMRPALQEKAFSGLELCMEAQSSFELLPVETLPRDIRSQIYLHEELTGMRMAYERAARDAALKVKSITLRRRAAALLRSCLSQCNMTIRPHWLRMRDRTNIRPW